MLSSPIFQAVKQRKKKKKFSPSRHGCQALIVIDATPIRKKAKRDYERALHDLEQTRSQAEEFHKEDKPRFLLWLNSHFGALLTEVREASQKLEIHRQLMFEVESEVLFSNISYGRAYQRVLQRKDHPEPQPADPPQDGAGGPGRESSEEEPDAGRGFGFGGSFEDALNDFFNGFEDEFVDAFGIPRDKSGRRAARGRPAPVSSRIKEMYRAVVRRLHPDTQSEMTAQKMEWWHQAQHAYQTGDVEQLEVILTLSEIEEKGTTTTTSVSLLHRIAHQLKSSLRALKTQLMGYKRDPAWNFSKRTDLDAFAGQTRRTLADDLSGINKDIEMIERQFRQWAEQALGRAKKGNSRRRSPHQPEFLF